MRKRISKSYTITFVSIAFILLVTIAYAGISSMDLSITGNAIAPGIKAADDFDVEFTRVSDIIPSQENIDIDAEIDSENSRIARFTVSGLVGYGDTAIVKYEVTNNSTYHSAIVSPSISNDNQTYFSLDEKLISPTTGDQITSLAPKETAILVIKSNVIKVSTTTPQTANVVVTLTVESMPYTGEWYRWRKSFGKIKQQLL